MTQCVKNSDYEGLVLDEMTILQLGRTVYPKRLLGFLFCRIVLNRTFSMNFFFPQVEQHFHLQAAVPLVVSPNVYRNDH